MKRTRRKQMVMVTVAFLAMITSLSIVLTFYSVKLHIDLNNSIHENRVLEDENAKLSYELGTVSAKLEEAQNRISTLETAVTYKDNFKVTAYCSCKSCCGKWAEDRPMIKGKEVVLTATGDYATQGITVAADPKVLPYGTKIYIEGIGVRVVQDTGGAIKGNRLDIYCSDHELARTYAVSNREVWIINEDFE